MDTSAYKLIYAGNLIFIISEQLAARYFQHLEAIIKPPG